MLVLAKYFVGRVRQRRVRDRRRRPARHHDRRAAVAREREAHARRVARAAAAGERAADDSRVALRRRGPRQSARSPRGTGRSWRRRRHAHARDVRARARGVRVGLARRERGRGRAAQHGGLARRDACECVAPQPLGAHDQFSRGGRVVGSGRERAEESVAGRGPGRRERELERLPATRTVATRRRSATAVVREPPPSRTAPLTRYELLANRALFGVRKDASPAVTPCDSAQRDSGRPRRALVRVSKRF